MELRDELAGALGWTLTSKAGDGWRDNRWDRGDQFAFGHPVPALDSIEALGWAAKMMPWAWVDIAVSGPHLMRCDWQARATCRNLPTVDETLYGYGATEVEARYRLLLKVLQSNSAKGDKP